ncbi:MAG: sortase [Bryobacteraceae bacterium]|jgi:sortase A
MLLGTAGLLLFAWHVPHRATESCSIQPLPHHGQVGNFVVLAHRDTFFRPLRELEKGDTVRIVTARGHFTYPVESLEVVEPEGISLTAPPLEAIATLITGFPFNYVGPAPRRFVATARLKEAF